MTRIVVVTGAAQGIGLAVAAAFSALGDTVIGLDVDDTALSGVDLPGFQPVRADVGDLDTIDRVLGDVVAQHGRIDVIVNNAGVTRRADLMDLTEADWDRIVRVNQKGVFFCMQRAAAQMIEQGAGRIINMASIAGRGYPASSNAIYAATKGAVITMTRMAAHRLGPEGITVNAVCPGITDTQIFRGIISRDAEAEGTPFEEVYARAVANVPVRRANTTQEVADLCVFLASDAARNITGQAINIDGGLVMS